MNNDLYKGFAERYDQFKGRFGEHDPGYIKFFKRIFKINKVQDVLDCACGTGHDLHLFHVLGCNTVGSDISRSMLKQASVNLAEAGLKVPLRRLDYRRLHEYFKKEFDAVVCLSSSILHMPNRTQVLRAFKSMYRVLRQGGILILTQGTTDKQWRKKPRFILAINSKHHQRLFVIDYLKKGARYNVLDVDRDGLKVWSIHYNLILLRDEYQLLIKSAGFTKINFYGSHNFEPYNKRKSDRLIIVACR